MPAAKKVTYKFKPPTQEIAKRQQELVTAKKRKEVTNLTLRGFCYDDIAEKTGLTVEEVKEHTNAVISKWRGETSQNAESARAVQIRRYEEMISLLWPHAYPAPYLDGETGMLVTPAPDPQYVQLILSINNSLRAMLGTDAAKKLDVSGDINVIRREYIGASPDDI